MKERTDLEEEFIELLPEGRENALPASYFKEMLHISGRDLRKMSEDLRMEGNLHDRIPICCAVSEPSGYYIGVTPDEVRKASKFMLSQGERMLEEGESMLQIADCMEMDIMDEAVEAADADQSHAIETAQDKKGVAIKATNLDTADTDEKAGAVSG